MVKMINLIRSQRAHITLHRVVTMINKLGDENRYIASNVKLMRSNLQMAHFHSAEKHSPLSAQLLPTQCSLHNPEHLQQQSPFPQNAFCRLKQDDDGVSSLALDSGVLHLKVPGSSLKFDTARSCEEDTEPPSPAQSRASLLYTVYIRIQYKKMWVVEREIPLRDQ